MGEFLHDNIFSKANIREWTELFDEFSKRIKEKVIIVIDEFPYLITSNKAIPSLFQKIWDTNLSSKPVYLLLLGSSIGMMETAVLGYKSPLYGRRTGQWKVLPLKFKHLHRFLPEYSVEDLIKAFSVTDGIPAYIQPFNPKYTFSKNLKNIFNPGNFLYQEAEFLLRQEFREQATYFNIAKAISMGRTKFGGIATFAELEKTVVSKYLYTLILLHVIKKEVPVTQKKETRNARYTFEDNYYNFWFRFVYPNKTLIEGGKIKELMNIVDTSFNMYVSLIFEKVCREILFDVSPIVFNKIGRWWHKDRKIDSIALNERTKEILFVECKWKDNVNADNILANLKGKSEYVTWFNDSRKEYFAVFAKSFSKKSKNCLCFDLHDLEKILHSSK
jgi:AAA+ ATPase superfamily predicted ATPase